MNMIDTGSIDTGARGVCRWCGEIVAIVIDSTSGVRDLGAFFEVEEATMPVPVETGLDYGCGDHPENDDEGTMGHELIQGTVFEAGDFPPDVRLRPAPLTVSTEWVTA